MPDTTFPQIAELAAQNLAEIYKLQGIVFSLTSNLIGDAPEKTPEPASENGSLPSSCFLEQMNATLLEQQHALALLKTEILRLDSKTEMPGANVVAREEDPRIIR